MFLSKLIFAKAQKGHIKVFFRIPTLKIRISLNWKCEKIISYGHSTRLFYCYSQDFISYQCFVYRTSHFNILISGSFFVFVCLQDSHFRSFHQFLCFVRICPFSMLYVIVAQSTLMWTSCCIMHFIKLVYYCFHHILYLDLCYQINYRF